MSVPDVAARWAKQLLLDPRYFWLVAAGVIVGDTVLTQLIVRYVPCEFSHSRNHPQY